MGVGKRPWVALKGNPLDWLLEEDNPPVRYLTLTGILERRAEDPEVVEAKKAIWGYPPVQRLVEALQDAPFDLDTLVRLGVPADHPSVAETCEKWLDADISQTKIGGCYLAQNVAGLIRYGYFDDPRLQPKIRRLLTEQRFYDGNRPGTYLRYTTHACFGAHSCFSACVRPLWALSGIPVERRTPEVRRYLKEGAEFLVAHRLYKSNHRGFRPIKRYWLNLHLPFALGWRTDVLDILDVATQVGLSEDPRIVDALRFLIAKQNDRGRWPLEEQLSLYKWLLAAKVQDVENVGEESKWVTLTALTQLKRCVNLAARIFRGEAMEMPASVRTEPRFAEYAFSYDPADEAKVRREWESFGMGIVLEELLRFARLNRLRVGWHWGLVIGPEDCPEWCAAVVRWVPAKNITNRWRVCRVFFMARKGQFTTEEVSRRLQIPPQFEYTRKRKRGGWLDQTLWRVKMAEWSDEYEEIGVAFRDAEEFTNLRDIMLEALESLERGSTEFSLR